MITLNPSPILSAALAMAMLAVLANCDRNEQTAAYSKNQASVGQPAGGQQPLGHSIDSDGFTLRANLSRTDDLPDAMAQKYGIEPESDLFLLNLVVLEQRPDQQPVSVAARVSAKHEGLSGHGQTIDMRVVEADGYVSYIGTLDASAQRAFEFHIEAQPAGTEHSLHMTFKVQLEAFEVE